ncbi:acyl-CoA reductase [Pseudoduganella sp. FT93W]|uniref:long-chain-fatty-acyl-CoA reductase n=1 Tax=Duganella fentianensis TaxID=2692177 RepID=A0A845I2V8_9BURK|nr:acyl-CoA reductase [Duganella fentianensis]MYN46071.1 acyl-CoA reductase [Duganella fentianensis]
MPMLPAPDAHLQYLLAPADGQLCTRPLTPYHTAALEFLQQVSSLLMTDAEAKTFPDVIAFAYWCRKAHLARLQQDYQESHARLGLGMVYHIAPANVPVNFAFSLVFAMLAGNASVVRAPSKPFAQVQIICRALRTVASRPEHADIAAMLAVVQYAQNDAITAAFSALCQARIIWGGNAAISAIRQLPIPPRSVEVAFADRYSFCAIDAASILAASEARLQALGAGFYNDVFLMDQNACSSPHLVVWLGQPEARAAAKQRFWQAVYASTAAQLELQQVHAVDKYTLLCQNAIELDNISGFEHEGNAVYRVALSSLPDSMDQLRGKYGMVYEYETDDLHQVAHIVNNKYQTLTHFGLSREQATGFVLDNRLAGIDRIVPIGTALDIGIIWDGYDMVRTLSRIVDFKS